MRPVQIVLLLLAVVLAAWFLWPSGTSVSPSVEPSDGGGSADGGPPMLPGLPRAARRDRGPAMAEGRAPAVTPVDLGSIRATLVPTDGAEIAKSARIEIESLGAKMHLHPLGMLQSDGTYVFEEVPTGRYRLRVMSEGSQETTVEVTVEKAVEAHVEITLVPGALASYSVVLYSGEVPSTVMLTLFDGRGQRIAASYQTSATTLHVPPEYGVSMPATGKLIGLRPGRYTLMATSQEGETDEKTFDAKTGDLAVLELKIRK